MSKELTVKEERVKDLASKCPEYKMAMETLFPGVFESKKIGVSILDECKISAYGNAVKFKHDGYYVCTIAIDLDPVRSWVNALPSEYEVSLNPFYIRIKR